MSEVEERAAVVTEARTWLRTPFQMNGMVKGAGVDCLRLVWRAFIDAGVLPDPGFDPWPHHSDQMSQHSTEETYVKYVEQYAEHVERAVPFPADIVLFRRMPEDLCFAHAGLVTAWPRVIHVFDRDRGVEETNVRIIAARMELKIAIFDVWARQRALAT